MTTERVEAIATTIGVEPGHESKDESGVHIRGRLFTDKVESVHPDLAGTNRVKVDLDIDPRNGTGRLAGIFELSLEGGAGEWRGRLDGRLEGGLVVARGKAEGAGSLEGASLEIDYQQLEDHPGTPPCEAPLAFFQMRARVQRP